MISGLSPFGLSPFGLPVSASGTFSVADPLLSLLTDSHVRRTYLLYSKPLNPQTGTQVIIKLGDGFASQSNDTLPDGTALPHALFRAGLITAYSYVDAVMQNGQLVDPQISNPDASSGSQSGEITFETATGRLIPLKSLEWDAAETQILLGRPEYRLSQFVPIFSGVAGTINASTVSECHVPLINRSYRLNSQIIQETYRGSGASLRGDGSSTRVTGALTCPVGSMALEAWIRIHASATAQKPIAGWINGTAAGQRQLRLSATITNAPEVAIRNDAGTLFVLSATTLGSQVFAPHVMYHIAFILDVAALTLTLIVDLDFSTQTVYTMPVTGTFNTVLGTLGLLTNPDVSAGFTDIDIDEVRIYPVALPLATLNANRDRQLVDTSITTAYYKIDEGTGATLFDSSAGAHNLAIAGTVKWVGSLEGDTALAGQYPPLWEGVNRQVEPVSVDSQNYVYEVSHNPLVSTITVSDVSDKGNSTVYTIDAAVSDIYDWTPVLGHVVTSRMGTRTLLRLERPPQGTLTVTVSSDARDFATIIRRLVQVYPTSANQLSDAQIDLIAFLQTAIAYPQTIGMGLRNANQTIWALVLDIAKKSGAWVTFKRTGELTVKVLEEPVIAKFYLTENDVKASEVSLSNKTLAVKRTTLNFRPYQMTQPPGNLDSSTLTQAAIADLGKPTRSKSTPISAAVIQLRPSAQDLVQDTLYDDPDATYTEAIRRQALWGVNRATYNLPLTRGAFRYSIGDVLNVSILGKDGNYVESLQNALLVIVGYSEDAEQNVTLQAWGLNYTYVYLTTDDGRFIARDSGEWITI